MAPKGHRGEGSITNIRWRLVMGLVALAAAVALTFPTGVRAAHQQAADIWPNGAPDGSANTSVADIWPNTVIADIWPNTVIAEIWPNGALVDIGSVDGSAQSN
ncbi:MAG TPA: hypothetical protein VFR68_08485 [Candidatus Dormibacteraeota bacterium]|nr:hypothetical protein [Candidatus Dormibacteraeota bacterium]